MCLTEAVRVVEALPDEAIIERGGRRLRFANLLAPEARAGDWVVVGMGMVLCRIEPADRAEPAVEPARSRP